jgi:hypothetical protein
MYLSIYDFTVLFPLHNNEQRPNLQFTLEYINISSNSHISKNKTLEIVKQILTYKKTHYQIQKLFFA